LSDAGILNGDYSLWMLFSLFIGVALAVDFGIIGKIRRMIRTKCGRLPDAHMQAEFHRLQPFTQAVIWTIVWISLAGIFAGIIFLSMGYDKTLEYVTGYIIEKSLSVDNMFVFLLIFSSLGIPYAYQHKVLMVGILSAMAMRIPLILVGLSLFETFHWMTYIFGGLLLFTAIRLLVQKKEKKIEIEKNIAVRIMKKAIPVNLVLNGDKFFVRKNGILYATPMLVSLVIVEMTDLVFAVDSIPAILAITTDPFIVITSNIFAILGLRSLYFLLAGLMEKFYYLKPGLVALLFFIGFKMLASEFFKIPIVLSLVVVSGILVAAIALSFIKTRQHHN